MQATSFKFHIVSTASDLCLPHNTTLYLKSTLTSLPLADPKLLNRRPFREKIPLARDQYVKKLSRDFVPSSQAVRAAAVTSVAKSAINEQGSQLQSVRHGRKQYSRVRVWLV